MLRQPAQIQPKETQNRAFAPSMGPFWATKKTAANAAVLLNRDNSALAELQGLGAGLAKHPVIPSLSTWFLA